MVNILTNKRQAKRGFGLGLLINCLFLEKFLSFGIDSFLIKKQIYFLNQDT
jgi:hypothetical protein